MNKSKAGSAYFVKTCLSFAIAMVWLINGLFCKLLNFAPRHQLIVARILGEEYSFFLTRAIGISEILMFVWIVSRIRPRWCAVAQIMIIATMNTLEFILVPDILLFGRLNALLALLLISTIFYNEFILKTQAISLADNS